MVERIERIARVKPVDEDVGRRFDSRNQRDDKNNSFLNELRRVLNRKPEPPKPSEISAAYDLEITGATQSLFYFSNLNFLALMP